MLVFLWSCFITFNLIQGNIENETHNDCTVRMYFDHERGQLVAEEGNMPNVQRRLVQVSIPVYQLNQPIFFSNQSLKNNRFYLQTVNDNSWYYDEAQDFQCVALELDKTRYLLCLPNYASTNANPYCARVYAYHQLRGEWRATNNGLFFNSKVFPLLYQQPGVKMKKHFLLTPMPGRTNTILLVAQFGTSQRVWYQLHFRWKGGTKSIAVVKQRWGTFRLVTSIDDRWIFPIGNTSALVVAKSRCPEDRRYEHLWSYHVGFNSSKGEEVLTPHRFARMWGPSVVHGFRREGRSQIQFVIFQTSLSKGHVYTYDISSQIWSAAPLSYSGLILIGEGDTRFWYDAQLLRLLRFLLHTWTPGSTMMIGPPAP